MLRGPSATSSAFSTFHVSQFIMKFNSHPHSFHFLFAATIFPVVPVTCSCNFHHRDMSFDVVRRFGGRLLEQQQQPGESDHDAASPGLEMNLSCGVTSDVQKNPKDDQQKDDVDDDLGKPSKSVSIIRGISICPAS